MVTKDSITMLRNALRGLDSKAEYASYCERLYTENPFSQKAEERFDKAYESEYAAFTFAGRLLSDMIGCDMKTAKAMIRRKRSEIDQILDNAMTALQVRR